ncbi:hypothetical protein [Leptolyngbya sp. FACHB-261]|uniref:hypothetical protein n=1 Tax=Leptolyngbya sp. FACHB-261 TaxID=2692806 RepID=UPI00168931DF|nr:hypothetical protein [Leptolyngbya sp. FACHB-261]MBD2102298.1 hypothetical protein [Leptolyngbya sp. FACHB-261]
MASGVYALAHIGHLRLYVGDASAIKKLWPLLLEQLNSGTYPNAALLDAWNREGDKRRFSFHTLKDIATDRAIIGIERLLEETKDITKDINGTSARKKP